VTAVAVKFEAKGRKEGRKTKVTKVENNNPKRTIASISR
tara:strand:- start:118 stop:234 length:117 start_codon:yes stop_codon:yes gene_type:complete